MNFTHLQILIPIIIVAFLLQLYFFWECYKLINNLKQVVFDKKGFETKKIYIPGLYLDQKNAKELLDYVSNFSERENDDDVELLLIDNFSPAKSISREMIDSINIYLIKNKGMVSDYNMLRDIVNRYTDSVEEEISAVVPVPLYIGLIGTMIGIVSGLFGLDLSIIGSGNLDGLKQLMEGVGWAMIASCTGLIFTTINSGCFFKKAKFAVEKSRNKFFTYLQTELLPVLAQDATTSIFALQKNLTFFNEKFELNIHEFTNVLGKVVTSFDNQAQMIQEIQKLDIATIQKYNVKVLKELKDSVGELEKFSNSTKDLEQFSKYISQVTFFVEGIQELNSSIAYQLERTNSIEEVIKNMNENTLENRQLIQFLMSHFEGIEHSSQLITNAINGTDHQLSTSFNMLQEHAQQRLESIKEIGLSKDQEMQRIKDSTLSIVTETTEKIDKSLSDLHSVFETKVSKLEETEFGSKIENEIVNLKQAVEQMNESNQKQLDKLIEVVSIRQNSNKTEISANIKEGLEERKLYDVIAKAFSETKTVEPKYKVILRDIFFVAGSVACLLFIVMFIYVFFKEGLK